MTAAMRRTGLVTAGAPATAPTRSPARPELTVLERRSTASMAGRRRAVSRLSLLRLGAAFVFLFASMLGSLMLRTQMQSDSFENLEVQRSIARLQQDIQDDQGKLDQLEASLPDKAQEMGMVAGTGSVSIDLNGYKEGQ